MEQIVEVFLDQPSLLLLLALLLGMAWWQGIFGK